MTWHEFMSAVYFAETLLSPAARARHLHGDVSACELDPLRSHFICTRAATKYSSKGENYAFLSGPDRPVHAHSSIFQLTINKRSEHFDLFANVQRGFYYCDFRVVLLFAV